MSSECLIAEFSDYSSFQTALQVLEKSNYTDQHVSVVTQSEEVAGSTIDDRQGANSVSPPSGKTTGAATLAGGTLGAMLGSATLMGPLIVAGPLLGMAAGAAGGSVLSSIDSWGVDGDTGEQFAERVRKGSRLIILTGNDARLSEGERLLQTCDPKSLERFEEAA
ncbi:Protein of unknown function [Neorhodopirellula lusitana]|uniref:DUF1269 domain-containing protein n=1 Tax=Neorhodopirellula lusitana TaxID=445327 RepID=A0ABY1QBY5_9BACT|nr:DUF1269 domain-containing protein [Neorhodopirellula lusitana]SMP66993.1 Protein of unknown function [Neorhodopirellula lusitana]